MIIDNGRSGTDKEYRRWQQCKNRCTAALDQLPYPSQDGRKGNSGITVSICVPTVHILGHRAEGDSHHVSLPIAQRKP